MKSPTKEQIEEALWNAGSGPAYILAAAYRSALARAELAERHYREATERVYTYSWGPETSSDMLERHERERKELEA
jgi:hypothetical protein